jgi:acetylornithine deacetylase/succinyl-diaminopimelate desuccinylase-like protein
MRHPPVDAALEAQQQRFQDEVEELRRLVRVPSVSAEGFDRAELDRSAAAVADLLRRHGFPEVEVLREGGSHPYVLAQRLEDPALPTVLLYAHHDVQPPGDGGAWRSSPFEPTLRDGRLFGRGAADDKAGVILHAAAVDAWIRGAGRLPVNVTVLVEGEEETGSEHLAAFAARHRERLRADAVVLADAGNLAPGLPCLTVSLRGLVCVDVEVRAVERSLHSGVWGGPVPDPAVALTKMLASLVDDDGRITIPGLAERVRGVPARQREALAALGLDRDRFGALAGLLPGVHLIGHAHPLELCWWEPALTVNAIQVSSRAQASNVVNGAAWAQVAIRIVPDLEPGDVRDRLCAALRAAAPWGVQVELRTRDLVPAWATDLGHPAFGAALRALEKGFGHPALAVGCGGSMGFVEPLASLPGGPPALVVGVEDPFSNAHSENESVDLGDLARAIRGEIHLLAELAGVLSPRGR